MKISPILTQLREQCPGLADHIAVGVDLALLQENPNLPTPSAHVTPLADVASASSAQNLILQPIRDRFDIVLALDASDATKALDLLHDLRAELWRALVGFKPGNDYSAIVYDGGELVSLNSSRAFYRLRFFAEFQLGRNLPDQPAQSWHERELDALASFTGATVRVDAIDPADPNLKRPGPDGRVEMTFSGDVTP
ncbi:phage tail terminator protein [Pseudomonas sp. P2757]|uniref:phage tail terminator protein n=1 Tax=unclassified Pseudomonas TaxID=196821 RepID=UPI003B59C4D2